MRKNRTDESVTHLFRPFCERVYAALVWVINRYLEKPQSHLFNDVHIYVRQSIIDKGFFLFTLEKYDSYSLLTIYKRKYM
jgi:hypothetical protein